MEISLLSVWNFERFGFGVLEFSPDNEDESTYSLIGFQYCREDRILEIDFLWHTFTFQL